MTKIGTEQANKLAAQLKDANFEQIIVSRLRRTQQTASVINKYHHVPTIVDARLYDNKSGFEGKSVSEHNAALELADDNWTARFNSGESFEDVKVRIKNFMDELKTQNYQSIVIVSSRTIIQMIYPQVSSGIFPSIKAVVMKSSFKRR